MIIVEFLVAFVLDIWLGLRNIRMGYTILKAGAPAGGIRFTALVRLFAGIAVLTPLIWLPILAWLVFPAGETGFIIFTDGMFVMYVAAGMGLFMNFGKLRYYEPTGLDKTRTSAYLFFSLFIVTFPLLIFTLLREFISDQDMVNRLLKYFTVLAQAYYLIRVLLTYLRAPVCKSDSLKGTEAPVTAYDGAYPVEWTR